MQTFLSLPPSNEKPRDRRRTHVLDKGTGSRSVSDTLEIAGAYVDLAKFGWGTSVVTPNLPEKIDAYRAHDVEVCFGGTLLELVYLQGKMDQYRGWLLELGVTYVEVSDGAVSMEEKEKLQLIEEFAQDFTVYSEVGSKDSDAIVAPARWVHQIRAELEAGAAKVILEGRESGTAGMYRPSGEIRMGLIQEIGDAGIEVDKLVFEAPNKGQQVWLMKHLGPDLNLGNIQLDDALPLETLRLGLRADTMLLVHPAE